MNMQTFDIDTFLKNYEPLRPENILNNCLKNKKLHGYSILSKNTLSILVPGKTYVKYMKNTENGNMTMIKSGGILLSGGVLKKNGLKNIDDQTKWTHLMLKNVSGTDHNNLDGYVYVINIMKYHIFYKLFSSEIMYQSILNMAIEMKNNIA